MKVRTLVAVGAGALLGRALGDDEMILLRELSTGTAKDVVQEARLRRSKV